MKLIDLLETSDLTNNSRFTKWFGDSVVVNSDGSPMVVYHGTGADINSFKGMVWASVDTELPYEYAAMRQEYSNGNANIIPLYMRIINPFNADFLPKSVTISEIFNAMIDQSVVNIDSISKHLQQLWEKVLDSRYTEESGPNYNRHDFWIDSYSLFGRDGANAIQEAFHILGFDGVKMIEGGEITYGAFSPNQVKSIYNNGLYNLDDHNISEDQIG